MGSTSVHFSVSCVGMLGITWYSLVHIVLTTDRYTGMVFKILSDSLMMNLYFYN